MVKLTFCFCFLMDRGGGALQAIERSFQLTKGRFWPVLGFMLLVTLMTVIPSVVVMSFLEAIPPVRDLWVLRGFLQTTLSVPVIFLSVFTFVYFKALLAATPDLAPPAPR
jgi:ABC-type sugar transport system permease subunit